MRESGLVQNSMDKKNVMCESNLNHQPIMVLHFESFNDSFFASH